MAIQIVVPCLPIIFVNRFHRVTVNAQQERRVYG
jgi:hypothetical protein